MNYFRYTKITKNLARYKSKNNSIELSKYLCRTLELIARIARISKRFAAFLITVEILTRYFDDLTN